VRGLLGWSAPGLAGRIRASAVPLGDLAAGEFVLFTSYISCGLALPISPFFLLMLEEFGRHLQHLMPHSVLQKAIFVHLCQMFIGVAPCTSLFRYFFMLVKSQKTRDHIGAYYFQTRPDPAVVYIPTFGGARWENWRNDWVIASAEANNCLVLPSDGPALDRKQWRTKPSLSLEFLPVLDRIKGLATGGLTLMLVVGDLLKRRIAPLQRRSRLCYWFTRREEAVTQREALTTEYQAKLSALDQTPEAQRAQQVKPVERLQKWQQELEGKASDAALAEENLKAKEQSLDRRETDLARRETDLVFREEMLTRRGELLAEHELEAEEKERKLEEQIRQFNERRRRRVPRRCRPPGRPLKISKHSTVPGSSVLPRGPARQARHWCR
jgi:hypothetical protein